ncbi:spore coat protein GerQ [Alteribacillus sp. JSM 102045]|uniref:spore coat protein GerQ n=1 Tax=Alteribacillus sp. JSM 102045 TaxID=1562101 RepID=UPI0035C24A12
MYNYYPWYGYPVQGYDPSSYDQMMRQQNGMNGMYGMNGMNENGVNGDEMLPLEESYIENILRLNQGKFATVYMTFENNPEWQARVFQGIIDEAGRDHIILRDERNNKWYLLLMVYLDYIVFDEEIEYAYPFEDGPGDGTFTQQPPR